ncbi:MAG: hypothetical protein AAFV85_17445 [Cyanobacteria bacterium J06634_6]
MNTQAHAILNLALLGQKKKPQWNPLIIWGALIPDLAMFVFFGWMMANQIPGEQIWGVEYFRPFWQDVFDFFNSIPLAIMGIAAALYWKRTGIALLFGSIMLHCLEDLPLHVDDGHRHFWPFSEFRFESPVSYWDFNHYGNIVAPLELLLVLVLSFYVFKRVRSRWTKGLVVVSNVLPLLIGLYFVTN